VSVENSLAALEKKCGASVMIIPGNDEFISQVINV
jgi:hypothetical protein